MKTKSILSFIVIIIFTSIFLSMVLFVSGAWFFKRSILSEDDLRFGTVEVVINNLPQVREYENEQQIDLNVSFKNVGSLSVAIRAVACVEWEKMYPMEENFILGEGWSYKNDGFYYYDKILNPQEDSSVFLKGVSFLNTEKNGKYKLPIYVESAQIKNDAYKDIFNITENFEGFNE